MGICTAYPCDRTGRARSTFSTISRTSGTFSPVLAVLVDFTVISMGISLHIHVTRTGRARSTFSPLSPDLHVFAQFCMARFSGVSLHIRWAIGHCISMGTDRTCPFLARFLRSSPRRCTFSPVLASFPVDFTAYPVSTGPDVPVRARILPCIPGLARFSPVLARFSGFHCRPCLPGLARFRPVLAVLVDFTAYPRGFHCISDGNGPALFARVSRFLHVSGPCTCTFSPRFVPSLVDLHCSYPWRDFSCISDGNGPALLPVYSVFYTFLARVLVTFSPVLCRR